MVSRSLAASPNIGYEPAKVVGLFRRDQVITYGEISILVPGSSVLRALESIVELAPPVEFKVQYMPPPNSSTLTRGLPLVEALPVCLFES